MAHTYTLYITPGAAPFNGPKAPGRDVPGPDQRGPAMNTTAMHPAHWAAPKGGQWHIMPTVAPNFTDTVTAECGAAFVAYNATDNEAPPTRRRFACKRCAAKFPALAAMIPTP